MKTIAIPTDFSFQTLRAMQLALQFFPNDTVHFLLFSVSELPTDAMDLLFLPSQEEKLTIKIDEPFDRGIGLLRKAHGYQIERIEYDHFWGSLPFVTKQINDTRNIDLLLLPPSEDYSSEQTIELIRVCPCPLLLVPDTFNGKYPSKVGWIVNSDFNVNSYQQATQTLFFDETVETLFMTTVNGQGSQVLKEHVVKLLDLSYRTQKLSFAFNRKPESTQSIIDTTISHQVDLLLLQQKRRGFPMRKKDTLIEEIPLLSPVPVLIFPYSKFTKAA